MNKDPVVYRGVAIQYAQVPEFVGYSDFVPNDGVYKDLALL